MKRWQKIGMLSVFALLPMLIAATSGIPSRPRFLSIGVNSTPPAIGSITASGTITGATLVGAHDASSLTGTLADARLSSNVPLKNAANVFSQSVASNLFSASPMLFRAGNITGSSQNGFPLIIADQAGAAFGGNGPCMGLRSFNNNNTDIPVAAVCSYLASGGSGGAGTDHSGGLALQTKATGDLIPVTRATLSESGVFNAVGGLQANGVAIPKRAYATLDGSGACGFVTPARSNAGVTSCSRSAAGAYLVNLTAAGFTAVPSCTATIVSGSGTQVIQMGGLTATATSFNVASFVGGTGTDALFAIDCQGT